VCLAPAYCAPLPLRSCLMPWPPPQPGCLAQEVLLARLQLASYITSFQVAYIDRLAEPSTRHQRSHCATLLDTQAHLRLSALQFLEEDLPWLLQHRRLSSRRLSRPIPTRKA